MLKLAQASERIILSDQGGKISWDICQGKVESSKIPDVSVGSKFEILCRLLNLPSEVSSLTMHVVWHMGCYFAFLDSESAFSISTQAILQRSLIWDISSQNKRQRNNDLLFPPAFHYKDLLTRFKAHMRQGSMCYLSLLSGSPFECFLLSNRV